MAWQLNNRQRWAARLAGGVAGLLVVNTWLRVRLPPRWEAFSGWVLLVLMGVMFLLPLRRVFAAAGDSPRQTRLHEWMGLLVLVGLLVHGAVLSAPATTMLALSILASSMLACFHPHQRRPPSPAYLKFWWFAHIILSLVALSLMSMHVFNALAY